MCGCAGPLPCLVYPVTVPAGGGFPVKRLRVWSGSVIIGASAGWSCMRNLHTTTTQTPHIPAGCVVLDHREFHRLKESWAKLVSDSGHGTKDFDPVVFLQRTGALIAAVEDVITDAETPEHRQGMDRAS